MKLTAQQVRDATLMVSQIIREARTMSQLGKFRLARLHSKLMGEFNTIEAQRDALIQEHGTLIEGTTDKWSVPESAMLAFSKAWSQVADAEMEVDVTPVSIADLDNIEAAELIMLGELVSE